MLLISQSTYGAERVGTAAEMGKLNSHACSRISVFLLAVISLMYILLPPSLPCPGEGPTSLQSESHLSCLWAWPDHLPDICLPSRTASTAFFQVLVCQVWLTAISIRQGATDARVPLLTLISVTRMSVMLPITVTKSKTFQGSFR